MMRVPKQDFRFNGEIFINTNMGSRSDWDSFWCAEDFLFNFNIPGKERPLFPTWPGCQPWAGKPWSNMIQVNCPLHFKLEALSKTGVVTVTAMVYDVVALDRNDKEFKIIGEKSIGCVGGR